MFFCFKKLMINAIPFVRNMFELNFTFMMPFLSIKNFTCVSFIFKFYLPCLEVNAHKIQSLVVNSALWKKILEISLNYHKCYFTDKLGYISFLFSCIVGLYPGTWYFWKMKIGFHFYDVPQQGVEVYYCTCFCIRVCCGIFVQYSN